MTKAESIFWERQLLRCRNRLTEDQQAAIMAKIYSDNQRISKQFEEEQRLRRMTVREYLNTLERT